MGLVGSMDLTDNMMLRSFRKGKSWFANRKAPKQLAEQVVKELEVNTPRRVHPRPPSFRRQRAEGPGGPGNCFRPHGAADGLRRPGLDIHSSYTIYDLINRQKESGVAVVYVGEDLDVLLELCDRILVLCGGKVSGIVPGRGPPKKKSA